MPQMTMAERILSHKSKMEVFAGDFCIAEIDIAMVHEMLFYMIAPFEEIGIPSVWDPGRIILLFDHYAPAPTIEAAEMHKKMREFAQKYKILNIYGANEGVCHQVLPERGWVLPEQLMVGTDSHMTTHGAFGAASTGIGLSEMISVFESGRLWFHVPETISFVVEGRLRDRVMSKDMMLEIVGNHGTDVAQYRSCEFSGSCISDMSISSRMTICNMAVELGAKFALITPDEKTLAFLKKVTQKSFLVQDPDKDAEYEKTYTINAEETEPKVACPHNISNVKNASELDTEIDQAFLGSCTNGRYEDMLVAAQILKGSRIAKNVRMVVTPASRGVYLECLKNGLIEIFIDSGAIFTNPTCGACWGGHLGVLAEGERVISSSNRNFKGRMGHPNSEIYIASPATVAASALNGKITDPRDLS